MKTGLVLEGGACRGVFTTGVLDEFMDRGLEFDYCIGVSAGAGNALNYKSRQRGRVVSMLTDENFPAYFGLSQARTSRKLLDLDLLYNTMSFEGDFPLDFAAYYDNPMECEYVLSDCGSGRPAYLREKVYRKRLVNIVKASSSMPGICAPVQVDGRFYLDGGVADPLPVERALQQGCDRVVLVTTKPADDLHPTDYTRLRPVLYKLYGRRFPQFYDSLMTRIPRYFSQLDRILELEKQGRVFVIRPQVCGIKGLEKDKAKMREYYDHGMECARKNWTDLMNYLQK